jgi:polysaccharide export outer membrane protein
MRQRLLHIAMVGLCSFAAACGGARSSVPAVEVMGGDDAYEFAASGPAVTGYLLATGDIFDVNFLFEPQLSSRVTVRPDGAVALPIMGEVSVAGRTPAQVDSLLTQAYATYFKDPEVTINVVSFAPSSVYVLGEVRNPGQVELKAGLSMLQALASVGGSQMGANLSSVILIRRTGENRGMADRVDLGAVLHGKKGARDVLLAPYDIVYVPATFVTQIGRSVDQIFGKLIPIPLLYLRGWEAFHTAEIYRTVEKQPANP